MLAKQRQRRILAELERLGAARVSDLAATLAVSEMTVRRDMEALAREGTLTKVHGGATLPTGKATDEPGFEAKSSRQRREKDAIAAAAAAMVLPGSAIALTAGTTTYAMAAHLGAIESLTVVTNSINVSAALRRHGRADLTIVLVGGVRTPSDALVGHIAVNALRSLHVDITFMGVHGMSAEAGFTTPNLLEAETNKAFVDAAARVVVPADHSKWGVTGLCTIASLDRADVVISDAALPTSAHSAFADHNVELVVATAPKASASRRVG